MTTRARVRCVVVLLAAGACLLAVTSSLLLKRVSVARAGGDASAPASPPAVTLFSDDFESGTGAWNLDTNWSVVDDGGNKVLERTGHGWATVTSGHNWTDYVMTVRVKRLAGAIQLMFRMSDDHGRYIVGLHDGGIYLRKETPWGKITPNLADDLTTCAIGTWCTISIEANLRRITVNVGPTLAIDHTDAMTANKWPLWQGNIGLEVTESSQAWFDDVVVEGPLNTEHAWVKTGGPIGGLGYDVRYASPDEQVMFVTDNYSGVNKSNNGGQTWYATNRGIVGRFWPSGDAIPVFTLNMDPNDYDNVWAGLKDVKGVYKSTNAGQTWIDVTPTITETDFVFRGFEVMPGNSDKVFAAGELPMNITGKEFGIVKGRIYYTENGGTSWTKIWEDDNLARYVIVHPENHDIIYASTGIFDREAYNSDCTLNPPTRGGVGVLKGEKSGSTWNWTVFDGDEGLTDLYVGSLIMHPTDPNILLAGAGNNACSTNPNGSFTGGVFLTANGGLTWTQTLTNEIITSVEFAPSNPQIAYAGGRNHFYSSEDGGQSWTKLGHEYFPWGPPGIVAGFPIDFLVDPDDPDTIFANNYGGGNVMSTDGGNTWTLASEGYTGALMFDVEAHPTSRGRVYASARSGAFYSTNGGDDWEGLEYPPWPVVETYAIALKPDNPQVVLKSGELNGKLYRSTTGGLSWSHAYTLTMVPGDRHGFKRIVFAPSNSDVVYAGSCTARSPLHGGNTQSFGIHKSTDGGLHWTPANDSNTAQHCVNDLAIHPDDENIVYAATAAGGLFKTIHGGSSWTLLASLGITDVRSVAIHPTEPNIVYAGSQDNGVFLSTSGGDDWGQLVPGMEPNDSIWAIVIDPVDPNVVYAGSFISGVYRWNTTENLWTHINGGLRYRAIVDLAISRDGKVLYAATWGEGVYRLGDPRLYGYVPLTLHNY